MPLKLEEIALLGRLYWLVVGAGAVFTMARFSEAFLVLRAQSGGLAIGLAPAVIAVISIVFAASAYPAGRIQDKAGARPLLLAGLAALIAADLLLGFGQSLTAIFAGIALWGLHLGLTARGACGPRRDLGAEALTRHGLRSIRPRHGAIHPARKRLGRLAIG